MSAFEIRQGDVLERLREMPDESVHCCVTSPPYFGLRDYGTGTWSGGDVACIHAVERWDGPKQTQGAQSSHASKADRLARQECSCGALRIDSQIGLEATPELFIAKLTEVFREVRRVLRADGVMWVNIGDSYAANTKGSGGKGSSGLMRDGRREEGRIITADASNSRAWFGKGSFNLGESSLKPKDLIGVPWMLAFALRADGWYLRSEIIWHKPNPMPESVTDRPTKTHEQVFLFSKSQRYSYDADAIREPQTGNTHIAGQRENPKITDAGSGIRNNTSFAKAISKYTEVPGGRNKRTVWTLATLPTPDAHFATFPIELPETCILAGCPVDGLVLDPFAGAGTTGLAALKNGRRFLGIELNAAYVAIAHRRVERHYPLLAGIA